MFSCQKEELIQNSPPTVFAGNDTTITLKGLYNDSIILNGRATDADGTIHSYLWSQVSGPTIASLEFEGSSSAVARGIISGTYVFQLMATDDKGAVGVKTVSISVVRQLNINLNSGLLAYFPFNNNYNDASGNGNHGTLTPAGGSLSTDNNNIANSAFNVNGTGQGLLISNSSGKLMFDSSFTVAFNSMTRDFGRFTFISMVDFSTGYGQTFALGTTAPGSKNFNFGLADLNASCNYWVQPSEASVATTDFIPLPGQWNNYVCTFNKGVTKVYVNGKLVHSDVTKDKVAMICPASELVLGSWWQGDAGASHNGKLDEVRLYNRELAYDEIMELSKDFR